MSIDIKVACVLAIFKVLIQVSWDQSVFYCIIIVLRLILINAYYIIYFTTHTQCRSNGKGVSVTTVGHFEKWLPQPSDAEFGMAQYPNKFIIG